MSRRKSELARDLAAIEGRYQERRQEIERSYSDWGAELDRLEQAIAQGKTTRDGALRSWRRRYPGTRPMDLGEAQLELYRRLRDAHEDYRRELEAIEIREKLRAEAIAPESPSAVSSRRPHARRQRPPDLLSVETVRKCAVELGARQRQGKPHAGPWTLQGIAQRLKVEDPSWNRARVTQAERLLELGWPLLRSHPDFSADKGHVRWPSVSEAARLLRSA